MSIFSARLCTLTSLIGLATSAAVQLKTSGPAWNTISPITAEAGKDYGFTLSEATWGDARSADTKLLVGCPSYEFRFIPKAGLTGPLEGVFINNEDLNITTIWRDRVEIAREFHMVHPADGRSFGQSLSDFELRYYDVATGPTRLIWPAAPCNNATDLVFLEMPEFQGTPP